jgi:RNA polymerase sigma-70 factor (ECF subfamily)
VLELMRGLPEKQREVLRLKFQHGLSYKQIAGITNESTGNVGWLIHMGIKKLREELSSDELEGAQA